MTLYDKVKMAADKQGLSIRKVEITAGVGNGVIRSWQKFEPKLGTLTKVAKVLNMDVKEFL